VEGLVDHFVTLERLPEPLEFPADLKDRIRIDAQSKRLYFRGYMSKADFDRICMLTKDWSFRRKLEELFQVCVDLDDEPPSKSARGLLSLFKKRAAHM
jgi:hypothetical protein